MKQDATFFEGKEPVLIYIAKKLRDALRLESVLAESGIDYGVETDQYSGGIILKSLRTGAFFYVLAESAEAARGAMLQAGFKPHVE
jgi:vacuolar-type H+-ATPase subunit E/Vma4